VFYGLQQDQWPKAVKRKSGIELKQPLHEGGDEEGVADLALRLLAALQYHAAPSKHEMQRLLGYGGAREEAEHVSV
jgi:hypothetical protein